MKITPQNPPIFTALMKIPDADPPLPPFFICPEQQMDLEEEKKKKKISVPPLPTTGRTELPANGSPCHFKKH